MSCIKVFASLVVMVMLVGGSPVDLASNDRSQLAPAGDRFVPSPAEGDRSSLPAGSGEFIENGGQWDEGIRFLANAPGCDVAFQDDGVMYMFHAGGGGQAVKVTFADGDPGTPRGTSGTGTVRNYLMGSDPGGWVTGVGSYRELTYEDVWPGVDVRWTLGDGGLKYDVLVGPEADPAVVRFDVDGASALAASAGGLEMSLPGGGSLRDVDLVAWHEDGEPVKASFLVDGTGYGFSVDKEPGRALVIDPLVVLASTFLGGTYRDEAADMVLDGDGTVVVAGITDSTDFPVTPGAFCATCGEDDLVVTRLDRNCTTVIWSTFIGGGAAESIEGMDLDADGNVYITGHTMSGDFPVTGSALQSSMGGAYSEDLYVLRLSSDGQRLDYSTYLGGSAAESGGDVVVRGGRAYVTATTESADFPLGNISGGYYKGVPFLIVLSGDGSRVDAIMSWSVTRTVRPEAIALTGNGTAVIGGLCGAWDLPTTPGAYMEEPNYNPRSFIIKCDPWSNATHVCSYFSEAGSYIERLALDAEDNIYVSGLSYNRTGGIELTEGAWCTTRKGSRDLFLTKLDANVTRVVYSTLVGGNSYDFAGDLAVTSEGIAVLGGWCWDATGLETTGNAHDADNEGVYEGFVVVLSEDGGSAVMSTFLGGTHGDHVTAVAMTPDHTPLLAGYTESADFPVTEDAYQREQGGDADMLVMELACLHPPGRPLNLTATGGDGNITLSWEPPRDTNGFPVVNYTVHRRREGGGMEVHRVTGPTPSFLDEDVEYGVYYTYGVTAFNGKGMGPMSDLATARTVSVPDPPANLSGTVLPDHVRLDWETPGSTGGLDLADYNVYRRVGDGELELVARVNPLLVSFVDTDVEDTLTYTYVLAATNQLGESLDNPLVTLRMTGVPTPPLALGYTYGERYIRLHWSEPLEDHDLPVARYHVYRKIDGGEAKLVGVVNAPGLTLVDRAVEAGVVYRYHVVAENAKGMSDPSSGCEAVTRVRPLPPRDVVATSHERFVRVTWGRPAFDGASPVLSYRVYLVDDGGDVVPLGNVNVAGVEGPRLAFLHEVAYDGVVRTFHVTAVNAEGESDPSAEARTLMFSPPARPRSLEAEAGDGQVTLNWSAPERDGGTPVTRYFVHRSLAGGDAVLRLATVPASTHIYRDASVANGEEYAYWLTALNLAGESNASARVTVRPAGPPSVPENLVTEALNGSVTVRWDPPPWDGGGPVLGYRLLQLSEGGEGEVLTETGPDQREFRHRELVNGRVYRYAVQAFSAAGTSQLSPVAEGRPAGAPSSPQAPMAVWMDGMVYVTWSSPASDGGSPVTGYRVRRTDQDPGNWTDLPALGTLFSDRNVERNATYDYTVHAVNGVGEGPAVRVSITTPPPEEASGDDDPESWPWAILGASAAALAAAVLHRRRDRHADVGIDGEGVV